jgi:predicted LPLAT superfamily acyltransferase
MRPVNAKTGKAYGSALGYGFFHLVIRLGGVRLAYALLYLVLPYYLLLRPSVLKCQLPYLRRRFPGLSGWALKRKAASHLAGFAKVLIDQAAAGVLGPASLKPDFPGQQGFYQLAARPRGLVLLTSHVGAWLPAMATLERMPKPVHLMMDREFLGGGHFFELAGIAERFRFISPRGPMGGVVQALQALQQGGCVSAMGDRQLGPGRELCGDFLGSPAAFPASPFHLASAADAGVAMLLARRTGPLAVAIESHVLDEGLDLKALPREEAAAELLRRYIARLEDYTSRHPEAWYNFYDFWGQAAPATDPQPPTRRTLCDSKTN